MKINPTSAKEISDKGSVQIGDTGREYPVAPKPPKAVSDKSSVQAGDVGLAL
jgi:hypothetical protein